jgi:hypothetical protein
MQRRKSIIVHIFKNKEDIITKNQFGFMPRRSTIEAIYYFANIWGYIGSRRRTYIWSSSTWRRHMTRYQGRSCGRHRRNTKYITLIRDMYDNVVTSVCAGNSETDTFPITIGLHKGSTLSPYLFSLVMDEVMKEIEGDIQSYINYR